MELQKRHLVMTDASLVITFLICYWLTPDLTLNYGAVLLTVFTVSYGLSGLLTWINRQTKRNLSQKFGINAQVYLGSIGIILHEGSHTLASLIFGRSIKQLKLIQRPTATDPRLGYVIAAYNPNSIWQQFGGLFVGLAPIIGCSLTLFGLTKWLLIPDFSIPVIPQITAHLFSISGLIWFCLTLSIAVGGFDLSAEDYRSTLSGVPFLIILTFLLTMIFYLFNITLSVTNFIGPLLIIFGLSLLISIIVAVISRLLLI